MVLMITVMIKYDEDDDEEGHGGDDVDGEEQVREEECYDDDVCLIALPLFHRRSLDSFYMNTNLNAISNIRNGIDGINLTKDFSYNMPDILTKQIST